MIIKLDVGVAGRLTSWLFKERGPGVELGTIWKKSTHCGSRVEDLNQGSLDFKSNALNHSVKPLTQYTFRAWVHVTVESLLALATALQVRGKVKQVTALLS